MRCLLVAVWIGVMSVALWGRAASEIVVAPPSSYYTVVCACISQDGAQEKCVCGQGCKNSVVTIRSKITDPETGLSSMNTEAFSGLIEQEPSMLLNGMTDAVCRYKAAIGRE